MTETTSNTIETLALFPINTNWTFEDSTDAIMGKLACIAVKALPLRPVLAGRGLAHRFFISAGVATGRDPSSEHLDSMLVETFLSAVVTVSLQPAVAVIRLQKAGNLVPPATGIIFLLHLIQDDFALRDHNFLVEAGPYVTAQKTVIDVDTFRPYKIVTRSFGEV